jgi:ABC-type Zn uptake system ZnuABC Zn-binding protein ZnuA
MKRVPAVAMLLLAGVALVAGCSRPKAARKPGELRILCSSYPIYLFTRAVAGSQPDVLVESMLACNAGCEHDYSLTPQDLARIEQADVFVITGLGMERNQGYLDRIPKGSEKGPKVLDSSAGIGDLIHLPGEEWHAGPMLSNPHLFSDPRMAARVVRNIARQLGDIAPAHRDAFNRNGDAYAASLDEVADEFAACASRWKSNKIVTMHAEYDYFARTAGLQIVGVIEDIPNSLPSSDEVAKLVDRVRSMRAAVFTEPQYPKEIGEKIAKDANVPVATLDSVATGPENPPADYYQQVMRKNLKVLKDVLGVKEP